MHDQAVDDAWTEIYLRKTVVGEVRAISQQLFRTWAEVRLLTVTTSGSVAPVYRTSRLNPFPREGNLLA